MPCYTVQRTELNMRNVQPEILKAALEAMGYHTSQQGTRLNGYMAGGYSISFDRATGILTVPKIHAQILPKEYSRQIISEAAQQFGWTMTETTEDAGVLQRRF